MVVNTCDQYVARSLLEYGEYNEQEWDVIAQLYARPGCIVEVGANMGSHSVAMARKAAQEGREFIAYEPQPAMFQLLCANLALNGLVYARALPYACASRSGVVSFEPLDYHQIDNNFGGVSMAWEHGNVGMIDVPCVTLDEQLAGKTVGLIKIDVEGFEEEVLRGATKLIADSRPLIYLENDRSDKSESLQRCIQSLGYDAYWSMPPLFNEDNFRGKKDNIFGRVVSLNMLCVPAELGIAVHGFAPAPDPTFHPVSEPIDPQPLP